MIIDTSALIAVFRREGGYEPILTALLSQDGVVPAPVIVEFARVVMRKRDNRQAGRDFLAGLVATGLRVAAFDADAAQIATDANEVHGEGNGSGGKLNMLDLMVYGLAKTTGRPILCTGKDFSSTDALIHPASRIG